MESKVIPKAANVGPPKGWRDSLEVDITRFDWTQFHPRAGLRRVPAIVICLILGLYFNQPTAAVVAASAAFSVGLGGLRQVRGSRLISMLATALFMSFSAVVGSLAGNIAVVAVSATCLWGFLCGMITVLAEDAGWVIMQGTIALMVSTAFPAPTLESAIRGLCILVGASVQIPLMLMFWGIAGIRWYGSEFVANTSPPKMKTYAEIWHTFIASFIPRSVAFAYAVRLGVTMGIAIELDRMFQLQNGYWLPMTTIIIMKPDFYRTYTGAVERVIGTFAGVVTATLVALLFHPHQYVLVALAALFSFLAYVFLKTNSVAFSTSLTALMVFVITISGYPETSVAWHRFTNTFLGSALALFSRFIDFNILLPFFRRNGR